MKYYVAIDIGASSGRHIVGWKEGGELCTKEVYRFYNGVDDVNGTLVWDVDRLFREIVAGLKESFRQFGKNARGFLTNEAVMIGMETRTSSPVRILRRPDTLQHVRLRGLFPCGEGAGYAGGIVSAGIDGERCAEAAAQYCEATRQTTY